MNLNKMNGPTKNKERSKKDARDIRAEALKIANSQHIEGQSREQTRLIAAGIQRGMEQFLRQQSEKARELDKRVKKVKRLAEATPPSIGNVSSADEARDPSRISWLPWVLLAASWVFFFGYVLLG